MTNPWVVCSMPVGFRASCPDDMDYQWYMQAVLLLITLSPTCTQLDEWAESVFELVHSYHDAPHDEYSWQVVENIVRDATALWPHVKQVLTVVDERYPGYDVHWAFDGADNTGMFLQIEEI